MVDGGGEPQDAAAGGQRRRRRRGDAKLDKEGQAGKDGKQGLPIKDEPPCTSGPLRGYY